jgi:hypothetical protein
MRTRTTIRLQRLCAGVVIAISATACVTAAPRAGHYIAPPIGSTWVVAVRESGSFGTRSIETKSTMAQQSWEGRTLLAFQGSRETPLPNRTMAVLSLRSRAPSHW